MMTIFGSPGLQHVGFPRGSWTIPLPFVLGQAGALRRRASHSPLLDEPRPGPYRARELLLIPTPEPPSSRRHYGKTGTGVKLDPGPNVHELFSHTWAKQSLFVLHVFRRMQGEQWLPPQSVSLSS